MVIAASVIFARSREEQQETVNDRSWTRLAEQLAFVESPGGEADPDALLVSATDLDGTLAGPWAAALVGPAFAEQGDFKRAVQELEAFASANPNHPLAALPIEVDGDRTDAISVFRDRLAEIEAFKASNPALFSNPPAPADAPRVRLETSAGPIVVALYNDKAPDHTENFLAKVRGGEYDGTKFHRVIPGFMIQVAAEVCQLAELLGLGHISTAGSPFGGLAVDRKGIAALDH
ncbi:MAG: peptidylprolyl isomerase, partial [Planctomycetota bacterium]